MKQSELAAELGVSRSYLSEIESEKKVPTMDFLKKYSEKLGLPISALLYISESLKDPKASVKNRISSKAMNILKWVNVVANR